MSLIDDQIRAFNFNAYFGPYFACSYFASAQNKARMTLVCKTKALKHF